jgi:predicted kinase
MKLNLKEPFVIIMVGTPLSGKSFWIKENYPDTNVISRDEIVMEVYGSNDYNEAFANVNQKEVNKRLEEKFIEANILKQNVIIDMTHMTPKRRKHHLGYFDDDFYKVAVTFPFLSEKEYFKRNVKRNIEENKNIPLKVLEDMKRNYSEPTRSEGFNKIINL